MCVCVYVCHQLNSQHTHTLTHTHCPFYQSIASGGKRQNLYGIMFDVPSPLYLCSNASLIHVCIYVCVCVCVCHRSGYIGAKHHVIDRRGIQKQCGVCAIIAT